jgi:hemerythrin-like domain-containing protein
MKITEALLAEHLVFHNLFDHIEKALPSMTTLAEVRTVAALLEAMLKGHSDTEDDLFLGPLEHCFEQMGQRESFLEEHQEIDRNLKEVQDARYVKEARLKLLAAVTYSRRHFDREERLVFPLAEKVLNGKTLTSLGQTWMDQRI